MRQEPTRTSKKAKAKQQSSLTFRMNVLFFSIFVIFSVLIFRLGYLQIVKGEDYVRMLERKEEVPVNTSVPRGRIYDRYGRMLVNNHPEKAITYTKMQTTKTTEMLEIAEQLAQLIEKPTTRVTPRDKEDFWILRNREDAYAKVPKEEQDKIRLENEDWSDKQFDQEIERLVRERISEEDLNAMSEEELEILAIYREMAAGYNLSPQIIKGEDVTADEFARVSERLSDLKGVNTTTDWKREKLAPLALLGRTTTPLRGIPNDRLNYFLARDYSRNDRVGESYFEAQYEELLQGQKAVVKNITDKSGAVVDTVTTYEGKPGYDLVTTIDSELTEKVEPLVEKHLRQLSQNGYSTMDRAFVVLMNPKTGEILSMVGKKYEENPDTGANEIVDFSYGAFTTAYEAGSSIKAATVAAGYQYGKIGIGQGFYDAPTKIAGMKKYSYFNKNGLANVYLNEISALERSSNIYMFNIASLIGGRSSLTERGFQITDDAFDKMRYVYQQFGLGSSTGIDLPNEETGVVGTMGKKEPGKLLDFSIGQYDTYTPLQMAQYISTIANDGYRVKPHMLKEVREPSPDGETFGALVQEESPTVLNRINNSDAEIRQIQAGLRQVVTGAWGTANAAFKDAKYSVAAKTGTAEVPYVNKDRGFTSRVETMNLTNTGYAPYDDPEVAYAVILPWVIYPGKIPPNGSILAREVLDAYFEVQAKHKKDGFNESSVREKIKPALSQEVIKETDEEAIAR